LITSSSKQSVRHRRIEGESLINCVIIAAAAAVCFTINMHYGMASTVHILISVQRNFQFKTRVRAIT
jgi:hypothetical protein